MSADTDQFRDLLDRWEDLHEQGQDPSVEELCHDCPRLAKRLQEWVRVLKMSEWMCQQADKVADDTFGEAGVLTDEEKNQHRTLGEYTLLEELGSGGMGRVFKAVHRKMDRTVAIKLLPPSLTQSSESVERFQRELHVLAGLSHQNIVAVHDAGVADGAHYYVMDLIEGRDLARLVKEDGPLPVERALHCILQTARGLEYAHSVGIVHRDIKPSNLIVDATVTVKILDLGIARSQSNAEATDDLTKTGCVLGTVDYMAPEQALNTKRADHRADIYSLGCTLYLLLTGKPLYGGDTVMERLVAHREHPVPSLKEACPAAPSWLNNIFQKMVAKKPEDRFHSVAEVIHALEAPLPNANRIRRFAVVMIALLAVAAAGTALFLWGDTQPSFPQRDIPSLSDRMLLQPPVRVAAEPPVPLPPTTQTSRRHETEVVKPTWRTTGKFPLIAGTWWESRENGIKVKVTQHDNEFVATTTYKDGNSEVSWRMEGKITKNGRITARLVHTHPHATDEWLPQVRKAVLDPTGKSLRGYGDWGSGGSEFEWTLIEPRAADATESSR